MDEELEELTFKLKEAINKDKRIKELNEAEEAMNNSIEVSRLVMIKEQKVDDYNFMCSHFKDDSEEVIKARQALSEAKKNLESHPLVRTYLEKFKLVRELNEQINKKLFSFFNNNLCK